MLELNLTKKLEKGENVALVLEKGLPLTKIRMGLGWEFQTIEDYSKETNPRDLKDLALNWIKFIK